VRGSITSSEEEGETKSQLTLDDQITDLPWVNHVIDELVAETPHLQTDSDGNQSKEDFKPPHPPDGSSESLDILLMLIHELGREKVGPELIVSLGPISFRGY